MSKIGIIGGTGLTRITSLEITKREVIHTPYGEPSGVFSRGELFNQEVIFLARHGYSHRIPPHEINYKANIWAMQHLGIEKIIAFGSVGGITPEMKPEMIVIPDQIIDYTYSRGNTFFEGNPDEVVHVDFTSPYSEELRNALISSGKALSVDLIPHGVYAAMQGPRLETAAEINKLERDGCDIVGMTAMPEAVLAKELGIDYATCALISNLAAGRGAGPISIEDINKTLNKGIQTAAKVLELALQKL